MTAKTPACAPNKTSGDEGIQSSARTEIGLEQFHPIKDAANLLGLHYGHLRRSVKRGLVPSHRQSARGRYALLQHAPPVLGSTE